MHNQFRLVSLRITVVQSFHTISIQPFSENIFLLGHYLNDYITVFVYREGILILLQLIINRFPIENDVRQMHLRYAYFISLLPVSYKEQPFHSAHVDALLINNQLRTGDVFIGHHSIRLSIYCKTFLMRRIRKKHIFGTNPYFIRIMAYHQRHISKQVGLHG